MANDVLYANNNSYFNMQKFEDSISNRGIERQKRINVRRKFFIFDKILLMILFTLIIVVLFVFGRIIYENIKIRAKNAQIAKLEVILDKKVFDNDEMLDNIKDTLKYDNIKIKAYLELNMITPTEKNIIYFDKSDSEYVRQYENIK